MKTTRLNICRTRHRRLTPDAQSLTPSQAFEMQMTIQQCEIGRNADCKAHATAQQPPFNIGTARIEQMRQRTAIAILRLPPNHQAQPGLTSQPFELDPGLLRIRLGWLASTPDLRSIDT